MITQTTRTGLFQQSKNIAGTKDSAGEMQVKNGLGNHCWKLWHANVITWDGIVVPCCFDKDATHQLGNLKDMPFKEVWKSPAYHAFRKI